MITLLAKFFGRSPGSKASSAIAVKNMSKRAQAQHYLDLLKPVMTKRFNLLNASIVQLDVIAPNIVDFTDIVRKFASIVEQKEAVRPSDCFFTVKQTTLDKFFTDEDRMYISQSELQVLHREASRLCELLQAGERAEYGTDEHNLRILSKVLVGIKNVCVAVLETGNLR